MIAYQAEAWHDLFAAAGGASATLAGLLFVAVSLNHEQVLKAAGLPALAAQSISVLIGLVVLCLAGLAPGQPLILVGVEVLVLGVALSGLVLAPTLRLLPKIERLSWKLRRVAVAVLPTVPMLVTGVSLVAGAGGGFYWALGTIVAGLVTATYNAWVLLIEIRR